MLFLTEKNVFFCLLHQKLAIYQIPRDEKVLIQRYSPIGFVRATAGSRQYIMYTDACKPLK